MHILFSTLIRFKIFILKSILQYIFINEISIYISLNLNLKKYFYCKNWNSEQFLVNEFFLIYIKYSLVSFSIDIQFYYIIDIFNQSLISKCLIYLSYFSKMLKIWLKQTIFWIIQIFPDFIEFSDFDYSISNRLIKC